VIDVSFSRDGGQRSFLTYKKPSARCLCAFGACRGIQKNENLFLRLR
jgi:hypothetical protein